MSGSLSLSRRRALMQGPPEPPAKVLRVEFAAELRGRPAIVVAGIAKADPPVGIMRSYPVAIVAVNADGIYFDLTTEEIRSLGERLAEAFGKLED